MRVAADDDAARFAVALLDHDLVADPLARVVEGGDPLLADPLAQHAVGISDDGRGRRCRVVDEDADLRGVPDALPPEVAQAGHDRIDDRVVDHDA